MQLALGFDHESPNGYGEPDALQPRTVARRSKTAKERSLHFVKYMGSKRNLLGVIAPLLREIVAEGGELLDLFAGSHAVGYSVKEHAAVWGNDIQHYSIPLGETLLLTSPQALRTSRARETISEIASGYFRRSSRLFESWLDREQDIMALVQFDLHAGLNAYLAYIQDLQAALPHSGTPTQLAPNLRGYVERIAWGERTDPPMMAAVYWANTYFSLEQGLWLDAYRQAIDDLGTEHVGRAPALAALLHSAAYCTHGTGHFAHHRKLTSTKVLADAIKYRRRSIPEYWQAKMTQIEAELTPSVRQNRVTTLDFREVLHSGCDGVSAIYADPPYSIVHYSRFYHVLETLTLYDHPGTEFDGRYRPVPLRHQSPFCIRTQVKAAFEEVLRAGRAAGLPIVWSYSMSGLMPFDDLYALCRRYYPCADVLATKYLHTTMGRRGDKTREVSEVLIICR